MPIRHREMSPMRPTVRSGLAALLAAGLAARVAAPAGRHGQAATARRPRPRPPRAEPGRRPRRPPPALTAASRRSSTRSLATVNGEKITRGDLLQLLISQYPIAPGNEQIAYTTGLDIADQHPAPDPVPRTRTA